MNKNKLLNDTVMLELETNKEKETTTTGGIILMTKEEDSQQAIGKVLSIGQGRYNSNGELIPMQVEVGDSVIIQKFAGLEIKVDGKTYRLVKESDVLYIL
jgi:chaperonin GroES